MNINMETENCPDETDLNDTTKESDREGKDTQPDIHINKDLVQITASNAEISRRIVALIERKQCEVDENNRQEFCGIHPSLKEDQEDGCARTKAVFVPRAGGKSHIKVSRVVNMYGPQTRALGRIRPDLSPYKATVKQEAGLEEGIEERLANMEEHLKMKGYMKKDLYTRLKQLEERILFLEGLSPEYFKSGPPTPKKERKESSSGLPDIKPQDMSLEDIQDRMKFLKESLIQRALLK